MELRQLRYFVQVVEAGSMSRAALDLGLVQSALSQQISRLEGDLATRLLHRTPQGVTPTEAGQAFLHEARVILRHAEQARRAAQEARLSGRVSIGLAPTTSSMLGVPLMQAMRARYPAVRLHMVESMSGHLRAMLRGRELDLAILFDARFGGQAPSGSGRHWEVTALLEESLFLFRPAAAASRKASHRGGPRADAMSGSTVASVSIAHLADEPLILPTRSHGLRQAIDHLFERARLAPRIVLEIDSLSMVMAAVAAGLGSTIQPSAALGRIPDADQRFRWSALAACDAMRANLLCSLADEELSPAALAARGVVRDCVRELVVSGRWQGVMLAAPVGHHES